MEINVPKVENATTVFWKGKTVTITPRRVCNEELQMLQDEDTIKPVSSSKWVTTIVLIEL